MEKFTAADAVKLSKENNADYAVEVILEKVKKAAKEGNFHIKVYEYGFGSDVVYYNKGYSDYPQKGKKIINKLRDLGFKADMRFDMNQLVDQYLSVSWKEED